MIENQHIDVVCLLKTAKVLTFNVNFLETAPIGDANIVT